MQWIFLVDSSRDSVPKCNEVQKGAQRAAVKWLSLKKWPLKKMLDVFAE